MGRKLEFRLHKVICVDETGGTFGERLSDDIAVAGLAVDATGRTSKIAEFKVGTFDDGKAKTFTPPRRLALFDLDNGKGFPRSYAVTLILAEKDQGGLSSLAEKLQGTVQKEITTAVAAGIGGSIGVVGGPAGMALGAAVGVAVGKGFGELQKTLKDDIFPPKTVDQTIKSADQQLPGGAVKEVVEFKAHGGTYRVVGDWRLIA